MVCTTKVWIKHNAQRNLKAKKEEKSLQFTDSERFFQPTDVIRIWRFCGHSCYCKRFRSTKLVVTAIDRQSNGTVLGHSSRVATLSGCFSPRKLCVPFAEAELSMRTMTTCCCFLKDDELCVSVSVFESVWVLVLSQLLPHCVVHEYY